ncbi:MULTISPECIES: hypothetical protein [unclassified Nocardioides]|uniref:hypothetical protein n=1 Tax=unclassified Nocardioides TaxID=2615069 RepID=UPI00361D276F
MRRIGTALPTLLLALVAVVDGAPSHAAETDDRPRSDRLGVQAIRSEAVVDSYGVGIHTNYLDTPYRDTAAVAEAVADLGVRHVRDDLYLDAPRQYAAIAAVAAAGAKFDLILGRPGTGAKPVDYVDTVAQLPAGAVESIEGVNEWDHFGGGDGWPREATAWQRGLAEAARADPATSGLPLLSPALAFGQNYPALGDLSPWSDVANAHAYPGADRPGAAVGPMIDALRGAVTGGPVVVTETGYHNAVNDRGSFRGVPEGVAGQYLPRLLLEHVLRGHARVYTYELIDEFDDPSHTDREANFGLLRHDLTPKPAYLAMRRLIGLLADDPPAAFEPGRLRVRTAGMPADGRRLLTQRSDGTYVLLLWRDVSVYDPAERVRTPVPRVPVTVRLRHPRKLTVHRVSADDAPARRSSARRVEVGLGAGAVAVVLGRRVGR